MSLTASIEGLIDEYGQTVTYRQVTAQTRDSATLIKTNTYTDTIVKAALRRFKAQELTNLIQEGDREMRIAADAISFTPKSNDRVTVNGEDFNVVSVDERYLGDDKALFICVIRGGSN